jgi:glycosyltransferase involved in cell wall biosynthesis
LDVDTSLSYQLRERYEAQKSLLRRWRAWVSWYKAYRYERACFRAFDVCAVVSPLEVATTQAMMGREGRVAVIPNGVDCAHHRPGLVAVRPHTLVYNGALTYSANYDAMQYFLAGVYPLIKTEVPNVGLSITGSTRGVDLDGLQLDESVHLTGYVDDVRQPVAQSAACVAPIRQGGGTRLKILEAMALGTPVVATSKGAEGLDMIDGEHLLIADAPDAFAEAVVNVLRDTELRRRLATHARALVEARYDWGPIGQQFVELVEEVTVKRGRKSR